MLPHEDANRGQGDTTLLDAEDDAADARAYPRQTQREPERIKDPRGGPDGEILTPDVAVEENQNPTRTHTLSTEPNKTSLLV